MNLTFRQHNQIFLLIMNINFTLRMFRFNRLYQLTISIIFNCFTHTCWIIINNSISTIYLNSWFMGSTYFIAYSNF